MSPTKMTLTTTTNHDGKGDLFETIGSFGPFQKKIFALFFAVNIVGVWQNFSITFLAPNMDYHCVVPEYNATSHTRFSSLLTDNNTNITDAFGFSAGTDRCHLREWPNRNSRSNFSGTVSLNRSTVVPCEKWEYDFSFYDETIVSEWDLVCEKEFLISLSKSIYMVGFLVSVLVFGQIADCAGRYPTLVICYVITLVSGLMSIFSQSYLMFVILRFFQAFGRTGLTTVGYVLLTEIIGPDKRDSVGITIQLGWTLGLVSLPALAWFVRSWVWLQVAMVVPFVPLVCICCFVPESPRWLRTRGKTDKFKKVVTKACKQNGRDSDFNVSNLMSLDASSQDKKNERAKTFLDLIRTPKMRKRMMCIAFLWFVNSFVYYSVAYNTNDLGGNPYLNFFLSGLIEIPSYLTLYFAIRTIGRRLSLVIGMFVAGASCAALMFIPPNATSWVVAFALIGRFLVNATFGLLYLYTTELFPTVVRNVAVGSGSTCARVGSILAPFARELGQYTHYTVPYGVNAVLAILSGLGAILLPETKDTQIPDTLEESENFSGKNINLKDLKIYKIFMKKKDCDKNETTAT